MRKSINVIIDYKEEKGDQKKREEAERRQKEAEELRYTSEMSTFLLYLFHQIQTAKQISHTELEFVKSKSRNKRKDWQTQSNLLLMLMNWRILWMRSSTPIQPTNEAWQ